MAADSPLCATTTRNCVAIWNLETGRLLKTFVGNARSAIVSHAIILADGEFVVSVESPKLLIWELAKDEPLVECEVGDIQHIIMAEEETKVVVFAKLSTVPQCKCVCFTVPDGEEVYTFEYICKKMEKSRVNERRHLSSC